MDDTTHLPVRPHRCPVKHVTAGMPRRQRKRTVLDGPAAPSPHLAFETRVGVLTHRVLADVFADARLMGPSELADLLLDAAAAAVAASGEKGRRRAAVTRVTTLVAHYIQRLAPPPFVEYVGAEQRLGAGRVDMVFDHPALGMFYDELKTWKNPMNTLDEDTRAQAREYTDAALALGRPCAGVRVLPLSSPADALLFRLDGSSAPLATTALSPAALLREQVALDTARAVPARHRYVG